jgi:sugar phosphate isomerase/epimerase
MLDIACQTYSLRSRTGPDMLASVRKAGFRAVELWAGHADYRTGDAASAAGIRAAADEIGIRIGAYCVGGFVRAALAEVESALEAAFRYARVLGVELLTGVVDRRAVGVVDRLCRRTGLRFAIENHWYADFARVEDYVEALRPLSPLVGMTLDTGHLAAAGGDPCRALAVIGERVFAVHLKDVTLPGAVQRLVWRRPRMMGCALGQGVVALGPFLAALAADGFAGSLAIEDERPNVALAELHASLREATRLLRGGTPAPPADGACA